MNTLGLLTYHVSENSACNYHRIANPMRYLTDVKAKVPVLFYNRLLVTHDRLDAIRKRGIKIIIDIDDDVVLGPDHVLYASYKREGMTETLIGNIQRADVVLATNAHLADRVRPYNPNIVLVPNALPFDEDQFTRTEPCEDRKIIYAGGVTHFEDLKIIQSCVPRRHMVIAGNEDRSPHWARIRSLYSFAKFKPVRPVCSYMEVYNGHAISVAPLTDTSFNRSKSNLKALEAGAKGLAFVGSKIHPYENSLDEGVVLLADGKPQWRTILNRLVEDESYRRERAEMLAQHVREHYSLRRINEIRRQVIESFS
ncbi:MAG: hypothetical protein ACTHOL_03825 [Luteibacter jiangsuensis]